MTEKYEITMKGDTRKRFVKAETKEEAAIKGAKKFVDFPAFKPVTAKKARPEDQYCSAYEVTDKAGVVKTVFVVVETDEQSEGIDQ